MKNLFSWLGGKSGSPVARPRPPGPNADVQIELTDLALRIAKDSFGTTLDFSHGSVKKVEAILAAVHREYEKSRNDDGLNGVALEFGAYIATTIQQNLGEGVLERDHPEFGEASFPFHLSRGTIFPFRGPGRGRVGKIPCTGAEHAESVMYHTGENARRSGWRRVALERLSTVMRMSRGDPSS